MAIALTVDGPRWDVEKLWAKIGFDQFNSGKTLKIPAGMTERQKQMVIYGWNAAKEGVEEL